MQIFHKDVLVVDLARKEFLGNLCLTKYTNWKPALQPYLLQDAVVCNNLEITTCLREFRK